MRRVLLMVMAIAAFMCVGTAGAVAGTTPGKPGACKGKKCPPKPPKPCKYGKKDGKCLPKPCPSGTTRGTDGRCTPPPPECPWPKDDKGHCVPPVVVHPPAGGPCAKADLVLLEDLLKGTGGLLCLYLGDNADQADKAKDCPDALLALPIDPLIGACLFLPPAEVGSSHGSDSSLPGLPGLPALPGVPSLGGDSAGSSGLQGLVDTIAGLLGGRVTSGH
jgi:hypothetical protein